jgi:hypothetical protein
VTEPIAPTYRWRRRKVVPTRVTWVGLVGLFLVLLHRELTRVLNPGMGLTVLMFIVVVLLPLLLLILWRAGLLPPERVAVGAEPAAGPETPPQP